MVEDNITALLTKYITLEANLEEIELIKSWIIERPENARYFAQLYEAWHDALLAKKSNVKDYKNVMNAILSKNGDH